MAKPEGWRLNLAAYPVSIRCDTRFQDLDVNRHLNNVAFAALFENARVQLHTEQRCSRAARPANARWSPRSRSTICGEGSFPDPVTIGSGTGQVRNSSWIVVQAMFQGERCIGTCDTVIVCRADNAALPIREDLRAALEELRVNR